MIRHGGALQASVDTGLWLSASPQLPAGSESHAPTCKTANEVI